MSERTEELQEQIEGLNDPDDIMMNIMDPPEEIMVEFAFDELIESNFVVPASDDKYELTNLGKFVLLFRLFLVSFISDNFSPRSDPKTRSRTN